MTLKKPDFSDYFNPGYYDSSELRMLNFKFVGDNVKIAKNCTIIGLNNITIGNNIRIDGNTVIAADTGILSLGDNIHIGGGCFLGCAGGIYFSDFSAVSQGVRIYSASDDYSGNSLTNPTIPKKYLRVTVAPVKLGRHVVIGSGSVILPGVSIGDGSSVGALSLVNYSLSSWGVYFGAPVKRLMSRSQRLLKLEAEFLEENEIKKNV